MQIFFCCSYCSHHEKICLGEACSPTTTTTILPEVTHITTDSSLCTAGEVWDECIIKCNQICHSFLPLASHMFHCSSVDDCVKGCRPKDLNCSDGKYLRDNKTCVAEKDCPCVSNSALFVEVNIKSERFSANYRIFTFKIFFFSQDMCRRSRNANRAYALTIHTNAPIYVRNLLHQPQLICLQRLCDFTRLCQLLHILFVLTENMSR